METVALKLTGMANGGAALGRDEQGRVIFVPFAIPGERVLVEITEDKGRFAQARLLEIMEASPERTEARCAHFGVCGGCSFQHMQYEAQLTHKRAIVRDQLQRIGRLGAVTVHPVHPHPDPWSYRLDVTFSPGANNSLGFWSPFERSIVPIEECHIIRPQLMALYKDIDLELPGLRSLTLRQGDDESLLLAMAIDGIEPPELNTDMTVSVAMILPDQQAANLVGDNYLIQRVQSKDFRVSAGCFFYPSPPVTNRLVEVILEYAALTGNENIVDAYAGVGVFSAFLAPSVATVHSIEVNSDAVADAATNLADTENVSLYEGSVEEVLPMLPVEADLILVDPPGSGLSKEALSAIAASTAKRLIYVSSDVATLARDGRHLANRGFSLRAVQPLDMAPQTYSILTVSQWDRN